MFRIVHTGTGLPASFMCDPSAEFEAGMIAELTVVGNQVMATVSKGKTPIGVIDDVKTKAFTAVQWNETHIVPVPNPATNNQNQLVLPSDLTIALKKPNIVQSSFQSTIRVVLNPINGIITALAGTLLNFDVLGTGTPNALKVIVNYTYYIPNIPGDDSTAGNQRVTIWYERMFFLTDKYETNQQYPLNCPLYVSEQGLLTSRRPGTNYPAVGILTAPPMPGAGAMIEVYWL